MLGYGRTTQATPKQQKLLPWLKKNILNISLSAAGFIPRNGSSVKFCIACEPTRKLSTPPTHGSNTPTGCPRSSQEPSRRTSSNAADVPPATRPCLTTAGVATRKKNSSQSSTQNSANCEKHLVTRLMQWIKRREISPMNGRRNSTYRRAFPWRWALSTHT